MLKATGGVCFLFFHIVGGGFKRQITRNLGQRKAAEK